MAHFIEVFPDAVPEAICDRIVARFEADPRRMPSRTQTRVQPLIRSGTMLNIVGLPEWQDVIDLMQQTIGRHLARYAEKHVGFQGLARPGYHDISPALLERIDPGQGYGYHIDAGPWGTQDRVLATILYLADIHQGGFTEFPLQSIRIQPKKGLLIMFPPFWTHLHRGATPEAGVKYNVTNFVVVKRPATVSAAA